MNKKKLINDPVYGFIQYPYDILYEIIDHPYVQRLRRISQMGLTHYVYPGAVHTRFHHTLGALHLMTNAINTLRSKDIEITDLEAKGACIAILMHDIGHGPFSHALEHKIIRVNHEFLSLQFMEELKNTFGKPVEVAIQIFKNEHHKHYLHQLVSSQLDMDRMDYLTRDSFFTGVVEGKIGYDRIIKMLHVQNNELVVEEKGIHSVEKFLMARRMMYWQVYLHKTSVAIENMLKKVVDRLQELIDAKNHDWIQNCVPENLYFFLNNRIDKSDFTIDKKQILDRFSTLDEYDLYFSLKKFVDGKDPLLAYLSKSILHRKIFSVQIKDAPFTLEEVENIKTKLLKESTININEIDDLILLAEESNISYSPQKESIKILKKNGEVIPINQYSQNLIDTMLINRYFLCYPKIY